MYSDAYSMWLLYKRPEISLFHKTTLSFFRQEIISDHKHKLDYRGDFHPVSESLNSTDLNIFFLYLHKRLISIKA